MTSYMSKVLPVFPVDAEATDRTNGAMLDDLIGFSEAPSPTVNPAPGAQVFSAAGTALRLRQIINRQQFATDDLDAIFAACRLIEDAMKRGVM